jgi:cytochrome c/quinol oxidase subunit I
MTWSRIPVFVWSILISTGLGLIVFPSFMAAVVLTLLDRVFGTSFYQASLGGNNFAYEQLFWFMGHPEVYVIGIPSFGVICEVINVVVTLIALAGALSWTAGYRALKAGDNGQAKLRMSLGWVLTVAGLIVDLIIFAGLKAPTPCMRTRARSRCSSSTTPDI